MNHPIRTAASVLVTTVTLPLLSACSTAVDFFGPRPDPVLVQLAAQAESTGDTAHADALWAEVARTCGLKDDGSSPHSCSVDHSAAISALATTPAPDPLAAAVPRESRPLVISQVIEDAAAAEAAAGTDQETALPQPATTEGTKLSGVEADQASTLLVWEQQLVWALNFAHAYADANTAARIETVLGHHNEIVRQLTAILTKPPVEAAGYTPAAGALPLPSDATSATSFTDDILNRTSQYWTAITTTSPQPAGASETGNPVSNWMSYLVATSGRLRADAPLQLNRE